MAIHDLNEFIIRFFTAHHCEILDQQEGTVTIQLTEDMDKALMNRPFYWHYIKKIGQVGEPKTLTFTTRQQQAHQREFIHFGSPRLQQIMEHLKKNERFTRVFQKINAVSPNANTALYPWLVVNIKLTYTGKMQKDEVFSIGLNLVTGGMKSQMMEYLEHLDLQNTISDYSFTISPMIKLMSGMKRIETILDQYLQNQSHDWAAESIHLMNEELDLLDHFYNKSSEQDKEQMTQEMKEINNRYEPKINFSIINGGIFYLVDKQ